MDMKGRVLVVAGSDSGGGAGIQADIKTITALNGFAMTAITALTAQNSLGVKGVHKPPPAFVTDQIRVTLEDLGADAVKTGMMADAPIIKAAAEGADLDVLLGAGEQIRNGAPQLAITTYHVDDHAERMIAWLRQTRPDYRLRLKGFSFWTAKPRPVLLQASTLR